MLSIFLYFIANSPFAIQKIADIFAPDYNITYSRIYGNALTGIEIDNLKYKNNALAKHIIFKWNPNGIAKKEIIINEMSVEKADIKNIKILASLFKKKDRNSSREGNSSKAFPFIVKLKHLKITLNPFQEQNITIRDTLLDIKNIEYKRKILYVDNLILETITNLSKSSFSKSLQYADVKLSLKKTVFDIENLLVKKATIELKTENNLVDIFYKTDVKDNRLQGKLKLKPTNELFLLYNLPLRPKALKEIDIDLDISQKRVIAIFNQKIKQLLKAKKDKFNLDINYLYSKVIYKIKSGHLKIGTKLKVDTPYAKNIAISNIFSFDNKIKYSGNVTVKQILGVDAKLIKPLNNLQLSYRGNKNGVKTRFSSLNSKGYCNVKNFKKAIFHIQTKKAIKLSTIIELPQELKKAKINFKIDTPISFNSRDPINAKIKINSNIADIDATIYNKDILKVRSIIKIPKNSLLKKYSKELKWNKLNPILLNAKLKDKNLDIALNANDIKLKANYKLDSRKIRANIKLGSSTTNILGLVEKRVKIETKVKSISSLIKSIKDIYILPKMPILKGDIDLLLSIKDKKKIDLTLKSSKIIYKASNKKEDKAQKITNIFTKIVKNDQKITVKNYKFTFDKDKIFSGKPSTIIIKDNLTKIRINSNIANIDATIYNKDILKVRSIIKIPKNSLLKRYNKELKWSKLNPIVLNAKLKDKNLDIALNANNIKLKANYQLDSSKIKAHLKLGSLTTNISGLVEKRVKIETKVKSISSLIKSVKDIYILPKMPIIKGDIDLLVSIKDKKKIDLTLKSSKIIYKASNEKEDKAQKVTNIFAKIVKNDQIITVKNYRFEFNKEKIVSIKPSIIILEDNLIKIKQLWLKDQVNLRGVYNTTTKKGQINTKGDKVDINTSMAKLTAKIDIRSKLDGDKTSVKGKIILLGGRIYYDLSQKKFASDSDIIIVQNIKKKKKNPFIDNLTLSVKIKSKKSLIFKDKNINIRADVDLQISKDKKHDILIIGKIKLLKKGSYKFENKKFILENSYIYFKGNPNKPLLDITVKYKSINHLIRINITGSPTTPNIRFSSSPNLSREQILSLILFDTETGAGNNSADDMMKMMGGTMAKSVLSNLGVDIDHLVLGENSSIEIGKKLTRKLTIIYVNGIVPSIKLKYNHNKKTQSIIGISEESQSYDIMYTRDF